MKERSRDAIQLKYKKRRSKLATKGERPQLTRCPFPLGRSSTALPSSSRCVRASTMCSLQGFLWRSASISSGCSSRCSVLPTSTLCTYYWSFCTRCHSTATTTCISTRVQRWGNAGNNSKHLPWELFSKHPHFWRQKVLPSPLSVAADRGADINPLKRFLNQGWKACFSEH